LAGDANLYRYCGNDPVKQVDPSGMLILVPWDTVVDGGYSYASDILRDQFYTAFPAESGPRESTRFNLKKGEVKGYDYGAVDLSNLPVPVWQAMKRRQNDSDLGGNLARVVDAFYWGNDSRTISPAPGGNLNWGLPPSTTWSDIKETVGGLSQTVVADDLAMELYHRRALPKRGKAHRRNQQLTTLWDFVRYAEEHNLNLDFTSPPTPPDAKLPPLFED
jgi:hypothetical protein